MKTSWVISIIIIAATNIYSNTSFALNSKNPLADTQQTQISMTKNSAISDHALQQYARP